MVNPNVFAMLQPQTCNSLKSFASSNMFLSMLEKKKKHVHIMMLPPPCSTMVRMSLHTENLSFKKARELLALFINIMEKSYINKKLIYCESYSIGECFVVFSQLILLSLLLPDCKPILHLRKGVEKCLCNSIFAKISVKK